MATMNRSNSRYSISNLAVLRKSSSSLSVVAFVKRLMSCALCLLLVANFSFLYYYYETRSRVASPKSQHQQIPSFLRKTEVDDASTRLRRNLSPLTSIDPTTCEFTRNDTTFEYLGRDGFEVIAQKVKVIDYNTGEELLLAKSNKLSSKRQAAAPRILCIVYSTLTDQSINSIKQTWGPKCDGFLNTGSMLHIPDAADNEWDKVRSIWTSIYQTYFHQYDFFFLGKADTYLIVENLRFFLGSQIIRNAARGHNWPQPLFLGDNHTATVQAGVYAINQASLQRLVERGFRKAICQPGVYQQKKSHQEAIGECLRSLSIFLLDTRDLNLANRFHTFSPQHHASEKYAETTTGTITATDGRTLCGLLPCPYGWESISEGSISFGHVHPNLMIQLHALLYNLCIPSELIQLASKVIEYHKVSGKNWLRPVAVDFLTLLNHPFMGALDPHGNTGFRHDEKALRFDPPTYTWEQIRINEAGKSICTVNWNPETSRFNINEFQREELGREGYKLLTEQVHVSSGNQQQIIGIGIDSSSATTVHQQKQVKVFCAVYTISPYHFRIEPIRQTWGPKCDGFMVASNVTIPSLNTVNIPHWGEENYNGVWQKLRSIWAYIYSTYADEYDFFYLGGDDYYLIVENLRSYVTSDEIVSNSGGPGWPKPLYLGRRVLDRHELNSVLNHGGPGYAVNRAALKLLVENAFLKESCQPFRWKHSEDRFLGECFRSVSVEPYNTRDRNFLHRFHVFTPYQVATGTWGGLGKWVKQYVCFDDGERCPYGWDTVSKATISFHYVQPHLMKEIHAALYSFCEFRQDTHETRNELNELAIT